MSSNIEYPRFVKIQRMYKDVVLLYSPPPERISREEIYLHFALMWSKRSVCKRLQVGAVITDPKLRRVLGIGYNGPARGLSHERCKNSPGCCGCLHAEANAVAQADSEISNKVMFITTGPCEMCAQLIIQNNISVVHILSLYRSETGVDLLRSGGVQVYRWKREEE